MESNSRLAWRLGTALVVIQLRTLRLAAEPAAPKAHVPLLWGLMLVAAFLAARIPLQIRKRIQPSRGGWIFWVLSLLAGAFVFFVLGPLVVGLGSILISGRTM